MRRLVDETLLFGGVDLFIRVKDKKTTYVTVFI